ncbi:MAG: DNA-binding domain-containing protein [Sphingomicrobium sp.]
MPDLATFQTHFSDAILNQASADPLTLQPGFAVYQNTAIKAAIDALRANFPTIAELVGEETFAAVASIFAHEYRPESAVLNDYGAQFSDFLAASPLADDLPYLPDVARIERLWMESFLAMDAVALVPDELANIAPDLFERIALHPASRHAWLDTPAVTIWLAHQQSPFDELEPEWQSEGVHVSRVDGRVSVVRISQGEFILLDALAAGVAFREAVDAIPGALSAVDLRAAFDRLSKRGALMLRDDAKNVR